MPTYNLRKRPRSGSASGPPSRFRRIFDDNPFSFPDDSLDVDRLGPRTRTGTAFLTAREAARPDTALPELSEEDEASNSLPCGPLPPPVHTVRYFRRRPGAVADPIPPSEPVPIGTAYRPPPPTVPSLSRVRYFRDRYAPRGPRYLPHPQDFRPKFNVIQPPPTSGSRSRPRVPVYGPNIRLNFRSVPNYVTMIRPGTRFVSTQRLPNDRTVTNNATDTQSIGNAIADLAFFIKQASPRTSIRYFSTALSYIARRPAPESSTLSALRELHSRAYQKYRSVVPDPFRLRHATHIRLNPTPVQLW